jgi:hypothetical protein
MVAFQRLKTETWTPLLIAMACPSPKLNKNIQKIKKSPEFTGDFLIYFSIDQDFVEKKE